MLSTALPKNFNESTKWADWKSSFTCFLRTQPCRNGVPLNYVIRKDENPTPTIHPNFIDDYVDYAPLTGNAFIIDAAKVNAFLMKLIADNPVAEQKVLPQKDGNNGRVSYKALHDYYE